MKKIIQKWISVMLTVVFIIGLIPCEVRAESTIPIRISGEANYKYAFQVLKSVNKERAKEGLPSVTMDTDLLKTAMKRAAETNIYFSHTRPDGSDCFTAFPQGMWACGENIAVGQSSPKEVMDSWMNSPGHRANILTKEFNAIGIGCYKAGNCYYWVQTFGQKTSVSEAQKEDYKNGKKAVTVQAKTSVLSLDATISNKTIKKGSTGTIKIKLTNKEFSYDTVSLAQSQFTFSSSNNKIASVNSKGVVKGLKKGKAKIKVKFKNGGKTVGKSITVTVK